MNNYLFYRRHPEYAANENLWKHALAAYTGGKNYIDQALIRHVSEIDIEFSERRRRAYYFNYPRAIARRITQYVLSTDPVRRNANVELLEDWSRTGLRCNEVMRQLSTMLNVYGRAWLSVEMPNFSGIPTVERARRERLRPYVRALSPLQVTDWAYGSDGKLLWALTAENELLNPDPFTPPVKLRRRRLYTREMWKVYEQTHSGTTEVDAGINSTGVVPLIPVTEPDGFGIDAGHWFEDVVRVSEAILNNESEAQMNTVKQMFGMLVVSESFARGAQKLSSSASKTENFSATVARSAAIIEAVDEKGISRFISPSGVETATIRAENDYLKRELYEIVGLAIQSRSRDNLSAESKAWDFQNASQFLAARADLLEQSELEAWKIMHLYDLDVNIPEVIYNRKFAVRDLESSIAGLLQLSTLDLGKSFHKAIGYAAAELLDSVEPLGANKKQEIFNEINNEELI